MRSAPTAANSTGGNQVVLKGGRKRSAEEQAQKPSGSIGTSGRKRPSRKKSKDTSVSLEGSTPWTAQINKEKTRDKHDSEDEESKEEEDTDEKEEEEDTDEKEEEEDTDSKDEEEEEDDDKKEDTEEEDNNYDPRDGGDDDIHDEILDGQVSRLKEKIHKHNAEEAATSASAAKAAMAGKRKQPPTGGRRHLTAARSQWGKPQMPRRVLRIVDARRAASKTKGTMMPLLRPLPGRAHRPLPHLHQRHRQKRNHPRVLQQKKERLRKRR
jgi:hypothetical protein